VPTLHNIVMIFIHIKTHMFAQRHPPLQPSAHICACF
jgi:hypothetical protein